MYFVQAAALHPADSFSPPPAASSAPPPAAAPAPAYASAPQSDAPSRGGAGLFQTP